MLFDFQRSVAPDKPLGDHEYHYVHEPNVSSEYARATYFHSYLHGLRMSQFWVWATGSLGEGEAGAGMKHTAWSQPRAAWGTSSAALDLRRLAKYVAAFPTRPQVLLYFSRPSLYASHSTHKPMLLRAYQAADALDAPIGFATDKMIRRGRLSECRLLVVAGAKYVAADVLAGIQAFVDKGGHVAMMGEGPTRDPYGRPHAKALAVPKDRLHVLPVDDPNDLARPVDQAFVAAGVTRPVRTLRADGRLAWLVECRAATVDGRRVCYIVGLNTDPIRISLTATPPVTAWHDLITDEKGTSAFFEIKPLEVRLLELTP